MAPATGVDHISPLGLSLAHRLASRWGPALRHREFRLLWLSLLPGTLGIMMASVAFGYVAYALTGSATMLALTSAGWGVPMIFVSPIAGVVADRYPRRNVLLATQVTLSLSAAIAAALVFSGVVQIWHLVGVALLQGTAFAFNMPARQALMAELVGPRDLGNAIALSNAGLNLNRILGPAFAGVLLSIPAIGAGGVFALMAALYVVVSIALLRLPTTTIAARPDARQARSSGRQLIAGLQYVLSQPQLRRLLLLAFLPVLFGMPYQSLMPATAARVFGVDAAGLGALLSANGVGALLGSLVVAAVSGAEGTAVRLRRLQLFSGLLMGIAVVAFGLIGLFLPALVLVALAGAAASAYTAVNNTLLMHGAEPQYHGRVMSVYMMAFASMPLSALPAAWAADHLGLPITLVASGVICATLVAALASGGARPLAVKSATA
ncbi:MAG TPA: MFS transporter [Chloroflexota bacterium]|nr:MFS transporter [Chloroflexota bacterium]